MALYKVRIIIIIIIIISSSSISSSINISIITSVNYEGWRFESGSGRCGVVTLCKLFTPSCSVSLTISTLTA